MPNGATASVKDGAWTRKIVHYGEPCTEVSLFRNPWESKLKSYHVQALKNRHKLDLGFELWISSSTPAYGSPLTRIRRNIQTIGRYRPKMRLHDFKKNFKKMICPGFSQDLHLPSPPDLPRDVTVARAPKDLSFGMEAAEAAERDIGSAPQLWAAPIDGIKRKKFVHRFSIAFPILFSISLAIMVSHHFHLFNIL